MIPGQVNGSGASQTNHASAIRDELLTLQTGSAQEGEVRLNSMVSTDSQFEEQVKVFVP